MTSVEHPSYREQIDNIDLILSNLTLEKINKLLKRFALVCVSFELLKTSGRINLIFDLKVQSQSTSSIELILKISNPHYCWKEWRTKNEVYSMKYLSEHTTIPIPKIFDYSDDAKTSLLSCEYILMEKIHGNTLESLIEKISDQTLLITTAMELTDYVKQLRQINLPQMNQIGSFCTEQMLLGGSIFDGPTLGPFNTVKKYITEHLRWSIQRIKTDEELFQHGEHLIVPLEEIIHHTQTDRNLSNSEIKFHLTHIDLNSSNILVDESTGQVLAILDWESCAVTFSNNDIEFYSNWFDDYQRRKQFESILQQQENYLDLFADACDMQDIKWYLDIMDAAIYAAFYSCTWFECEQMVTEHIKQFFRQTEEAIMAFNKHKLEESS